MPEGGPTPRVLIVVENLPVPFDRRVWHEATTLRQAGYEVSVICPMGKGYDRPYEVIEDVHVYRHPMPAEAGGVWGYLREYVAALYWEFRLSRRVRRERGFDVVHICNPPDVLFLVAGWYRLTGRARVVFDHHDVNPELFEEKFGRRGVLHRLLLVCEYLTMRTADVVISTNESYRRVALTRGRKRNEDVFVVRSAPDVDRFRRVAPDPALRKGRTHLVGYLGVMAEQDGVDMLLHVAREIVHERGRTDVGFLLVGGGPSLEALVALRNRLGLEDQVEFAGFQTGEELLRRLSTFDVGVAPDPNTTYNRMCTMNKTIEYMALGLPVVQFDLTEGRASAGDAAIYVEGNDPESMADAIIRLLDDPELRRALGKRGRERVERHLAWHHQAPHLLAAYARILRR